MPETKPRELFHRAHYNALAKEVRDHFPTKTDGIVGSLQHAHSHSQNTIVRGSMADFALSLCKRFKEDNPRFDPIKFLEACSPDNDLYPLAELWEEDANE
jgi:hypothetical protein